MIRTFCNGWSGEVAGQLRTLWGEEQFLPFADVALAEHTNQPKRVLHMAARLTRATAEELLVANYLQVKEVVDVCVQNKVDELIFFSTNSIYDHHDEENLPERNVLLQPSPYTLSKYWGEQYLEQCKIPKVLCLRFPGFLEVRKTTNFVSKTALRLRHNERIEISNGARLFNSFMAVPDLADFLAQVKLTKKFDVINLAAAREKSLSEVLQILRSECGSSSVIHNLGERSPFVNICVDKARSEYGYRPQAVENLLRQWMQERMKGPSQ